MVLPYLPETPWAGGWTVPLWAYVASFIPVSLGGLMMARTGRYVEDEDEAGVTGAV